LRDGIECLQDSIPNAPGGGEQAISLAGAVRKQDPKEDRVVAGPILAKRIAHVDHIRSKRAHYVGYGCVEGAALRDSARYVHESIIAQIAIGTKRSAARRRMEPPRNRSVAADRRVGTSYVERQNLNMRIRTELRPASLARAKLS